MTLRERLLDAFSKAPPEYQEGGWLTPNKPRTPEYEKWHKETLDLVEITPVIDDPDIDDKASLMRFMDLPKLLDLVVNRRLLLPRLAELKNCDPHECSARPDYSHMPREELERRVISLREFAPKSESEAGYNPPLYYPATKTFEGTIKTMPLDALMEAAWFVEHSRLKKELVCSCWYGSEIESDAMWRLYCGHFGVAITTSVSQLKTAVKCFVPKVLSGDFKLFLAKVFYDDAPSSSGTPPWMVKRRAFRHEHEVRLYVDYPLVHAPGFSLQIDPNRLIKRITVTPYALQWQADAIKETMERLWRRRRVTVDFEPIVRRSTHRDACDPSWPQSPAANYLANFGAMHD
jgi:hypothetical protein